jgi:hypothetical protein
VKCTDKVTNDGNSDFIAKNIRMRKSTDFEWPKMGERTQPAPYAYEWRLIGLQPTTITPFYEREMSGVAI